ncbi:DUF4179 domain-containing protein [Evansella tamaricis]|uniref:DUF4179 domain-containing protein n=1 Tax=Evansella tamaricis TaxID=2069301 RepID=A0ABS6JK08_9BACI|nr:DUF4179 domain-containing protein [Evansella tamaricis]MBU9713921.1 DUF4179 domain-containing protein [Evansella tamaricis]
MNELDKKLGDSLRSSQKEMPPEMAARFEVFLDKLPDNSVHKSRRKRWFTVISAAAILMFTITGLLFHPTVSQALQDFPLWNKVYQLVGDDGLKAASEKGLSSEMMVSATDNDITITITEAYYDGSRITFGYIETHKNPIPVDKNVMEDMEDFHLDWNSFRINGERWYESFAGGGFVNREKISDTEIAGTITTNTDILFTDSMTWDIMLERWSGEYPGSWDFTLENVTITDEAKVFTIQESYPYYLENSEFVVDRVIVSPSTLDVRFQTWYETQEGMLKDQGTVYVFTDSNGEEMEILESRGGGGHTFGGSEGKYYSIDSWFQFVPVQYSIDHITLSIYRGDDYFTAEKQEKVSPLFEVEIPLN